MTIPNLSGTEFEFTYTNCDTLAKEEAIRIYASRASVKGESFLWRLSNRNALLFNYDPGRPDGLLPTVVSSGNNRILISIPEVSSILFQSRKWKNLSIDYDVGHITYP